MKKIFFKISKSSSSLLNLPTPSSMTYLWNFGSLLGLTLMMQMMSGMFLAMHYVSESNIAFINLFHMNSDVCMGWMLSYTHINCASFFFVFVYMHISSNIYYSSYLKKGAWFSGMMLLFLMMLTAFVGYVLPWGQMSFWGATVMTNFASAIPYMGFDIVHWIWGGYSINSYTLMSFFSMHYLFPFMIAFFSMMHIFFLHKYISTTSLGVGNQHDILSFYPFFVMKDILGFMIFFMIVIFLLIYTPNMLNDTENFMKANSLVTPVHIVPEWYFLFAYTILSWVPNKLLGLMLLILSILVLITFPFTHYSKISTLSFKPLAKFTFWLFMFNFMLLSWLGTKVVAFPYFNISIFSSVLYFNLMFLLPLMSLNEEKFFFI